MSRKGYEFFDDDALLSTYKERRQKPTSPNETIEQPIFRELLGSVRGQDILDLGCGEAEFGRELLDKGARSYVGVEASEKMANLAEKRLVGFNAEVRRSTIEAFDFKANTFDLVISQLVLHYLEDLTETFHEVYRALRPGGRLVFSVEHPVITSSSQSLQVSERRTAWLVDDYFQDRVCESMRGWAATL